MIHEFIVWYQKPSGEKYSREFTLNDLIEHKHIDEICDCPLSKDDKIIDKNESIGKTDINDKKIYTNCSIVEYAENKYWYIKWCDTNMCYELLCISDNTIFPIRLNAFICPQLKIIDTIQENNLRLIK